MAGYSEVNSVLRDLAESQLADVNTLKVAIRDAIQFLDSDESDVESAVAKLNRLLLWVSAWEDSASANVTELDAMCGG